MIKNRMERVVVVLLLWIAAPVEGSSRDPYLDELNRAIESSGAHWIAGETEEARRSCCVDPFWMPDEIERITAPSTHVMFAEPLPRSLDWRERGGNYVTSVKNQGVGPYCGVFA